MTPAGSDAVTSPPVHLRLRCEGEEGPLELMIVCLRKSTLDRFLHAQKSHGASLPGTPRQRGTEPRGGSSALVVTKTAARGEIACQRGPSGAPKPGYRVAPAQGGLAHGARHARGSGSRCIDQ